MTDLVLLVNCLDYPIIQLLINLLRVGVDFIQSYKCPGIDEAKSVDEDFLFLLNYFALGIVNDLLEN